MSKVPAWEIKLGLLLAVLSLIVYVIDFLIFRDLPGIMNQLLLDIAFVPVYLLLVTIVLNQLLAKREKDFMMLKLNMVIGVFFHEIGTSLLNELPKLDAKFSLMANALLIKEDWSEEDFEKGKAAVLKHAYLIKSQGEELKCLKSCLVSNREMLLRLLENPNLLEHQVFSDLLLAVFHLADELSQRKSFDQLPVSDLNHFNGDIQRVYSRLVLQWIEHMKHLQKDYPYLFSLAIRMNPFDPESSPLVSQ